MPRTIEGILDSHRRASALRASGKPIWSATIDMKSIVNEDVKGDEHVVITQKAKKIAELFRRSLPEELFDVLDADYDEDMAEVIENLETYNQDELAKMRSKERQSMFNGHLDELYDWADIKRVWLGS